MEQLRTRLEALEHELQTVRQQARTVARQLRWWRGVTGGLLVLGVVSLLLSSATVQGAGGGVPALEERVAALEDLLKHFTREGNEVRITGANLQIVNGLGGTGQTWPRPS